MFVYVCLTAVGCADLQAPANAWLTRAGENVIIRCNDTHETWYFTCQRGRWLGDAGNCSTGPFDLRRFYPLPPSSMSVSILGCGDRDTYKKYRQ